MKKEVPKKLEMPNNLRDALITQRMMLNELSIRLYKEKDTKKKAEIIKEIEAISRATETMKY